MLDIILLGTGGTQPLPERALAAACITVGGSNLLLDCGEGTQDVYKRQGLGRVSVPMWPFNLSVRLPIVALVGRYLTN